MQNILHYLGYFDEGISKYASVFFLIVYFKSFDLKGLYPYKITNNVIPILNISHY